MFRLLRRVCISSIHIQNVYILSVRLFIDFVLTQNATGDTAYSLAIFP